MPKKPICSSVVLIPESGTPVFYRNNVNPLRIIHTMQALQEFLLMGLHDEAARIVGDDEEKIAEYLERQFMEFKDSQDDSNQFDVKLN